MAGGQNVFVADNVLTATQLNTYLMDQAVLRVLSTALPTTAAQGGAVQEGQMAYLTDLNQHVVYNGTAWVCINPQAAYVETSQTTTTTSAYTNLATTGPAVTLYTDTQAIVTVSSRVANSSNGQNAQMGWACSGATTITAHDTSSMVIRPAATASEVQMSFVGYVSGLTAGTNTFTAQYRVSGGSGTFQNRTITVVGIP